MLESTESLLARLVARGRCTPRRASPGRTRQAWGENTEPPCVFVANNVSHHNSQGTRESGCCTHPAHRAPPLRHPFTSPAHHTLVASGPSLPPPSPSPPPLPPPAGNCWPRYDSCTTILNLRPVRAPALIPRRSACRRWLSAAGNEKGASRKWSRVGGGSGGSWRPGANPE